MWKCTSKHVQEPWVHVTLDWAPEDDSEIRDGQINFVVDEKHDRYEVGEEFDYYPMVKPHKHAAEAHVAHSTHEAHPKTQPPKKAK